MRSPTTGAWCYRQALISPVLKSPDFRTTSFVLGDLPARRLGSHLPHLGRGMRPLAQLPHQRHRGLGGGDLAFNSFAGTNYGFLNRNPPPPVCLTCWDPGRCTY